ncbi:hypothetical protein SPAN111604_01365 [Sphingomonas antarctica]
MTTASRYDHQCELHDWRAIEDEGRCLVGIAGLVRSDSRQRWPDGRMIVLNGLERGQCVATGATVRTQSGVFLLGAELLGGFGRS